MASLALRLYQQFGLIAPFVALGILIESLSAADAALNWRHRIFNLAYGALYWLVDVMLIGAIAARIVTFARTLPGHGLLQAAFPDTTRPAALFLIAALWMILSDFFYYWMHRAQHAWEWLWAEHELHHADELVNVTTTSRSHWLEKLIQALAVYGPMGYLAAPPMRTVLLVVILTQAVSHWSHLNTTLSLGRWNWAVTNPHHHRIHHSKETAHLDQNFAGAWPVWDVLFGTYYAPQPREFPATGLRSGRRIETLREAAGWPFLRWWEMARGKHSR